MSADASARQGGRVSPMCHEGTFGDRSSNALFQEQAAAADDKVIKSES